MLAILNFWFKYLLVPFSEYAVSHSSLTPILKPLAQYHSVLITFSSLTPCMNARNAIKIFKPVTGTKCVYSVYTKFKQRNLSAKLQEIIL